VTHSKPDPTCRLEGADWALTFKAEALRQIGAHAQTQRASKESVGQLYCRDLTAGAIIIEHATVLPQSRAAYASVQFNPEVAAKERAELFKEGLHCVGLWHSHPQAFPHPSTTDSLLAADHARAAASHLNGLLFAILGTRPVPCGLSIWVHDGKQFWPAHWE
jgi:proteasome lid subunit RPN8/RPN11